MDEDQLSLAFKISRLLVLEHQGELSEEENRDLELWRKHTIANNDLYNRINDKTIRSEDIDLMNSFDVMASKKETFKLLGLSKSKPRYLRIYRMAAAAAAVLLVAGCIWIFTYHLKSSNNTTFSSKTSHATEIGPGKSRATLHIAGKIVNLDSVSTGIVVDSRKITYNNGATISKGEIKSFTVATPRAGTYHVVLPDGTNVWLNSATSLTYKTTDDNIQKLRQVNLSGEAYFEVTKDPEHPFVVESNGQRINVLGTRFNVNTYKDDGVSKTTLLEGSVQVSSTNGNGDKRSVILQPNQQSRVSLDNFISVGNVDVSEVTAWKNGDFIFNEEKLSSIAKKLERWYDVDIVLSESVADMPFTGKISRSRNISSVLLMIENANNIHFKIEGRRITTINQ